MGVPTMFEGAAATGGTHVNGRFRRRERAAIGQKIVVKNRRSAGLAISVKPFGHIWRNARRGVGRFFLAWDSFSVEVSRDRGRRETATPGLLCQYTHPCLCTPVSGGCVIDVLPCYVNSDVNVVTNWSFVVGGQLR